jgi:hypothetical protein
MTGRHRDDGSPLLCEWCQDDPAMRCRECCPELADDTPLGFSEIGWAQDMLAVDPAVEVEK